MEKWRLQRKIFVFFTMVTYVTREVTTITDTAFSSDRTWRTTSYYSSTFRPTTTCYSICTNEWDPVCVSQWSPYTNRCYFNNAKCDDRTLELLPEVRCGITSLDPRWSTTSTWPTTTCYSSCTWEYDPVCGSNGKTYSNECYFNNAKRCEDWYLEIEHHGMCTTTSLDPRWSTTSTWPTTTCYSSCTGQYDPVCGSNGRTYSNECYFNNAKRCEDWYLEIEHRGMCKVATTDCHGVCPAVYDPVCASNGVTYGNDCLFKFAKKCDDPSLVIIHRGECSNHPNQGPVNVNVNVNFNNY